MAGLREEPWAVVAPRPSAWLTSEVAPVLRSYRKTFNADLGSMVWPADWGIVRTDNVYAGWLTSGDAAAGAFVARYAFPDADVELQANLNLGLLVVATYVRFKEPGPYANRFTREFFRRDE